VAFFDAAATIQYNAMSPAEREQLIGQLSPNQQKQLKAIVEGNAAGGGEGKKRKKSGF
jgi:hypothetical protein